MSGVLRLTIVMTHPAQYMSPWFRHIAAHRRDLELTVLYGAVPDAVQQGTGFGTAFEWDVPLTGGYRFAVCSGAEGKSFDSDSFTGIDVPDIERRIGDTQPDVVLVPGWHSVMQVRALRACRRLGIPTLYRGDSTLFSGPRGVLRPAWALKTRTMLGLFDGYLAVGAHADAYLRSFGIADPLIVRSPHCVDNARFGSDGERLRHGDGRPVARASYGASDGDFVVLFAGKFTDRKRPLDAVRAVARLRRSALLLMAGDGPLRDACVAEAARLGVRVACPGFLNQSELPKAFAASDCVLVPSAWESWGLIVNEALASGVPCVVTDRVASARDLIAPGDTGYAVPVGDLDGMAAALTAVRAQMDAGHDFARHCRQHADRCSPAAAAEGLAVACRRMAAMRRAASGQPSIVACCGAMVSAYGLERSTFDLLAALRQHGASIHCVVNSWGSGQIADLAASIGASWTPGHYRVPLKWRHTTMREAARLAWEIVRVSAACLRQVAQRRASHVLVPDLGAALYNLPALALLRVLGVRVISRLGNAPEDTPVYRFLWGRVINRCITQFVANSAFTADALAATGVPRRRIRTIGVPPPARPGVAPSSRDERHRGRVIFVGQLIPQKGCDRLLEAIGTLATRGYDVSLDVVGDVHRWEPPAWKGYAASLQERARMRDLEGRVRFLGAREDVPALMASAEIHCFPSLIGIREGFGIVTVEAKCEGTPSVVTPSGALPEAVSHRQDGFVCADDSVDALVEGLEYFLADRDRLIKAGRHARLSAARYSRERLLGEWLAVFQIDGARAPDSPPVAGVVHSHGD